LDSRDFDNRIWRIRKRGDWIDASLKRGGGGWQLRFSRRGRLIAAWDFDTREDALSAGRLRLREFERAGWTEHW
jgi:hypothetical protein